MKILIAFGTSLLMVSGALAQGTVNLNNNIPGVVVTRVYLNPDMTGTSRAGNGINDLPVGNTDYSGCIPLQGSEWSAQIWAAPVPGATWGELAPAYPITTFRTGAEAGFVVPVTVTLTGVPSDTPLATIQLRVWNNEGGAVQDWESGRVYFRGVSWTFNVSGLGGPANPPATLLGLTSFAMASIPEPSSLALCSLGIFALGLFSSRYGERRTARKPL